MPDSSNASSVPLASHQVQGEEGAGAAGFGAVDGEACTVAAAGAGGGPTSLTEGPWPGAAGAGEVCVAGSAGGVGPRAAVWGGEMLAAGFSGDLGEIIVGGEAWGTIRGGAASAGGNGTGMF